MYDPSPGARLSPVGSIGPVSQAANGLPHARVGVGETSAQGGRLGVTFQGLRSSSEGSLRPSAPTVG
jgi:hypothetical protein